MANPIPSIAQIYGVVAYVISPNYPDAVHPNDDLAADWKMSPLSKMGLAKPLNNQFVKNAAGKLNGLALFPAGKALVPDQTGSCTTVFDVVETINDAYSS